MLGGSFPSVDQPLHYLKQLMDANTYMDYSVEIRRQQATGIELDVDGLLHVLANIIVARKPVMVRRLEFLRTDAKAE